MVDLTYREEILRKCTHVLAGVVGIPLALWIEATYGTAALQGTLLVVLMLSIFGDYLRNEVGVNVFYFRFLQRKRELKHLHAVTLALIAIIIALQFFQRDVVLASLLMFVFGDAAAAVVGKGFGRIRIRKKSVEGSLAMLVISLAVGWVLLPFWVALAMALAATLAEAAVEVMDDSLVILLFSSFVGDVLLRILV